MLLPSSALTRIVLHASAGAFAVVSVARFIARFTSRFTVGATAEFIAGGTANLSAAALSVGAAALLCGCSSTPTPVLRASAPTIYLQSMRAADPVADCLANRLPSTTIKTRADGVEIAVDGHKWLLEVSPTESGGALIAGHRGKGGDDIEPAVRFAIARCTL